MSGGIDYQAEELLAESKELLAQVKERKRECGRAESAARSAEVFSSLLHAPPIRLLVEENGSKLWRTVERNRAEAGADQLHP